MRTENILRLACFTRPIMRRRTPVLYRACKHVTALACPKGGPDGSLQFVAPFEGGRIHIDTASSIEYHLLFRGCHEPVVTDLIRECVKPGYVCLDVGANIGALTLVMAKAAGPEGRVVAVEPHPVIRARLHSNLALNETRHVQVIDAALSAGDGETTFYGFDEDSFNQGLSSLEPGEGVTQELAVRTITGETLAQEAGLTDCNFIKIDVEGHDAVVLRELWPLIRTHRPVVIFEYRKRHWDKFGSSGEDVVRRFRDLGYRLRYIRKRKLHTLQSELPDSCEVVCTTAGSFNPGGATP